MEVTLVSFKILPWILAGGINPLKTKSDPFYIRTLCLLHSKYAAPCLLKKTTQLILYKKNLLFCDPYKHVNTT